ncbi:MAG: M81 family peptidase [Spirochaetaceae bacterium]|nr:MAG: M81 family peptidase [Spirochaetaceae bacterium]
MTHTEKYRIGIGGIAIESSTFSPLTSTLDNFTILSGDELSQRYPFMADWVFDGRTDITWMPCMHAKAIPGGPVDRASYSQMKQRLLGRIADVLPLDGFYLDIHGAMNVVTIDDAETDLASAIRGLVGKDCVIVAGMDLHGNVSRELVEQVDIFTAYRLAPHDDAIETRERACHLLLRCLDANIRPIKAWVRIPVILPGERTSTLVEPGKSIFGALEKHSSADGVLDASLWVGYVWADEPRSSASVVVTGTDAATVSCTAETIARQYWRARERFVFGTPVGDAEWCIRSALDSVDTPVVISDSGDNPTAGGVGDVPFFLEKLLAFREFSTDAASAVFASIPDAAAVAACFSSGTDTGLDLKIGGKLDPVNGRPLAVHAVVESLHPGDTVGGDIAVIRIGSVRVIITSKRKPFHFRHDFTRLGITPEEHTIVAVKIGYLEPELRAFAKQAFLALTPGAVNQDIPSLSYTRVLRPVFPLDRELGEPDLSAVIVT